MLSRFAAPVAHLLRSPAPQPAPAQGVPELLAALAETRAKKAELEQREKELIAATQAKLREQEEALENLRRKVRDSGIGVEGTKPETPAPAERAALPPGQPAILSN
ncbi:MAG TPA: hypothetical protein VJ739_09130 [Gemmataceae bacterium]|nr:hypothetical protein [Gemmataceae bacterium]